MTDIFLPINNLVKTQFPQFYQSNGPDFIAFIQAYYQWLEEEGNVLYYSRNYYNIKDIDTTFDQFIVYFKEKYFKNIALGTKADIRLLIKHALDIYRSKGSQRATKLLFQLAFDENVDFYYPSTDLFKLSDGDWYEPLYLEFAPEDVVWNLLQKDVTGLTSGAIAYVDAIIQRFVQGRIISVAYISALNGNFLNGEKIQPTDLSLTVAEAPLTTGSLSDLSILNGSGGTNYEVGSVIPIVGRYGNGAQFLVTSTTDESGFFQYEFTDGGYGFTATPNVYISTNVLNISFVNLTDPIPNIFGFYSFLDPIEQSLASLNYIDATGSLSLDQLISTYYSNGVVEGTGVIVGIDQTNSTAGQVIVNVLSGNVANQFFTTSNTITANIALSNGYNDVSVTSKYIANNDTITIGVSNTSGFVLGETIAQADPSSDLYRGFGTISSILPNFLIVNPFSGMFSNTPFGIMGLFSMTSSQMANSSLSIGVANVTYANASISNTFFPSKFSVITSPYTNAVLNSVEAAFADLVVSVNNSFSYSENVSICNTIIGPYLSTPINALAYGLPGNTSANLTFGTIGGALSYQTETIGKLSSVYISGFPQISGLIAPYIVIDNPIISEYNYFDELLSVAGGNFRVGDVVQQGPAIANTSNWIARGKVLSQNGTHIVAQRLSFSNNFSNTTNNSTLLVSVNSGAFTNIGGMTPYFYSNPMGRNITADAIVVAGNNILSSGIVVDAGYGYLPDEPVTIGANGASGFAVLEKQGFGTGYYRSKGGFLSDQKKIFDGYFYQNYSYQIISSLMINKYQEMLNDLTHVAGTMMFGKLVYKNQDNLTLSVQPSIINTTPVIPTANSSSDLFIFGIYTTGISNATTSNNTSYFVFFGL